MDDFLFIGPSVWVCQLALDIFVQLYEYLGVPLAPDKTMGPVQALPFVGVYLDTLYMSASLPQDKIVKFQNCLDTLV